MELRPELDALMAEIHQDVNNASTGAASRPARRRTTRRSRRGSPDWTRSSERLAGRRYLMGDAITVSRRAALHTLVRFDVAYRALQVQPCRS